MGLKRAQVVGVKHDKETQAAQHMAWYHRATVRTLLWHRLVDFLASARGSFSLLQSFSLPALKKFLMVILRLYMQ